MAIMTCKTKFFKFRNFPTHLQAAIFFVERGYDERLNRSIINHLGEIRQLLGTKSIDFVYFPYLIQEMSDAAIYNFPQMGKADFSYTAASDIFLHLIDDDKQLADLPPCFMQYDRTEGGVDYVKAFLISIVDDSELMPWMEKVFKRLVRGGIYFSSVDEVFPKEDRPIQTADERFDDDVIRQMAEVYRQVRDLQLKGVSEWVLRQYLFPKKQLSRMVITDKYHIILPDYHDMRIKMEPLVKAVFILFLRHEEGIVFKL